MKVASPAPTTATRGRPREFDMDSALDQAERVFREQGYHGSSIGDLGAAMSLTAGSLYKAFGDKRSLFIAALDHYADRRHRQLLALQAETSRPARARLRDAVQLFANAAQGSEGRAGCLVVGSATELASVDSDIAAHVSRLFRRNEAAMVALIRQGQEDGSVASHINADATALALICLTQGMRVSGKAGRGHGESLLAVVDIALKMLD